MITWDYLLTRSSVSRSIASLDAWSALAPWLVAMEPILDRLRMVFRGDLRMSGRKNRAQRYLR